VECHHHHHHTIIIIRSSSFLSFLLREGSRPIRKKDKEGEQMSSQCRKKKRGDWDYESVLDDDHDDVTVVVIIITAVVVVEAISRYDELTLPPVY